MRRHSLGLLLELALKYLPNITNAVQTLHVQGAGGSPTSQSELPHAQDAPQGWERFALFVKNEVQGYSEYVRITLSLFAGKIGSALVAAIVIAFGLMLFLFLLCAALAVWVGGLLDSYPLGILAASGVWLLSISTIILLRKRLLFDPLFRQIYHSLPLDHQRGSTGMRTSSADDLMQRKAELDSVLNAFPARLESEMGALLHYMTIGMVLRTVKSLGEYLRGKGSSR